VKRLITIMALIALLPLPAMAASVAVGRHIARVKCAGCHGAGGAGDGVMLQTLGAPAPPVPWTSKKEMAQFTDAQLTSVIMEGGKALNRSPLMPPFGNELSHSQIADLVAYIRSLGR
jgi:cytochrome c oxidase cbb3-type subunit 3